MARSIAVIIVVIADGAGDGDPAQLKLRYEARNEQPSRQERRDQADNEEHRQDGEKDLVLEADVIEANTSQLNFSFHCYVHWQVLVLSPAKACSKIISIQ